MSIDALIVLSLVTWRVSHMIMRDDGPFDAFAKIRAWANVQQQATWLQRGLACMWCVSFWIGIAAAVLYGASALYGLALSAGAVLCDTLQYRLTRR